MLRRGINGLPIFRPDRGHIHHRLRRAGLSRQKTIAVLYAISLFALLGGLLAFAYQGRYLPIFFGFAFVIILFTLRGQKITTGLIRQRLTDSIQTRQDTHNALYLRDWLIGEVERADTGNHLWVDYRFVLKKMGFCRAVLTIAGDERSFHLEDSPHEDLSLLWSEAHQTGNKTSLRVYADKAHFSEGQFSIMSDLAAEAWSKASARWKEINKGNLTFEAEASEAAS